MTTEYLSNTEMAALVVAIGQAEEHSTGEIRIHIDGHTQQDFAKTAMEIFNQLEMYKTRDRNAVLFYINFEQHYLTIIGDEGIHKKVRQQFWDHMHDELTGNFSRENYFIPLQQAILKTGHELKKHFPIRSENPNELPNEITFS